MTILTSLLGTKVLAVVIFLLQEAGASPAASPAAAGHFTMTEMIRNMGAVAIGVIPDVAGNRSAISAERHDGRELRQHAGAVGIAGLAVECSG